MIAIVKKRGNFDDFNDFMQNSDIDEVKKIAHRLFGDLDGEEDYDDYDNYDNYEAINDVLAEIPNRNFFVLDLADEYEDDNFAVYEHIGIEKNKSSPYHQKLETIKSKIVESILNDDSEFIALIEKKEPHLAKQYKEAVSELDKIKEMKL